MDISVEKAAIVRRLEKVENESLILPIRDLLDEQEGKQADATDTALNDSVQRGMEQSDAGDIRPHQSVFAEIRMRWKA